MEQISIFDYLKSQNPPKTKEIGENCNMCKHSVWLSKDSKRIKSCDRYDGCKKELKHVCGTCGHFRKIYGMDGIKGCFGFVFDYSNHDPLNTCERWESIWSEYEEEMATNG